MIEIDAYDDGILIGNRAHSSAASKSFCHHNNPFQDLQGTHRMTLISHV